jgi:membrane protease YdiL (CAAX protease family)
MPLPDLANVDTPVAGASLLATGLGISLLEAWGWLAFQRRRKKPAFPALRRPVPWGFPDLFLIVVVWFAGFLLWASLWKLLLPVAAPQVKNPWIGTSSTEHPLLHLMQYGQWGGLLVAGISAVLVAPLVEEYFFRVFLQGWLENVERRHWRFLRRWFDRGVLPVLFSALPFALMHFRTAGPQPTWEYLLFLLAGQTVVNLLTWLFAIVWMRVVRGATAADLGWRPEKLPADLRTGILLFFAIIVPLYLIQGGLSLLLPPKGVAPDPVPLFLLAVVLGTAYYSTHRVAIVVTLHAAVNALPFFIIVMQLFLNR